MTTQADQDALNHFDLSNYESPLVTVDIILFTYHNDALKVLLTEQDNVPEEGKWALPSGIILPDNDLTIEDTAYRVVTQKTGIAPNYLEQLATVGNSNRDKRNWSVTICYSALIAHQDCKIPTQPLAGVGWHTYNPTETNALTFDHTKLIHMAHDRLKQKALYSIVPAYALPEKFTLPELQRLHETIIGKPIQNKSFRRRIENNALLVDTGEMRKSGSRPAKLYTLKEDADKFTFLRNLEN